jgi:hypothetical protein
MKRGLFMATSLAVGTTVILCQSTALASSKVRVAGHGTIGIRLVAPAGVPSSNPLASSYIVARMAPGDTLARTVEIDDESTSSVTVSIYVAAATVVRGQFVYAAGNAGNDLTSWTSVANDAIFLAPRSKALDTVTVHVPTDAPAGNKYAVVWAAVSAAPPGGKGITLVSRVGVRMYVSVGSGGGAPSNFGLQTLVAERDPSGDSLLVTTIHNSGANTLSLDGYVMLTKGPGGLRAGPFVAKLGVVLAPGSSEPATVELAPNFPRGPWTATLKVSSGPLSRSESDTITFPARFATPKASGGRTLAIEVSLALIALLALMALWLTVLRRRRFSGRRA